MRGCLINPMSGFTTNQFNHNVFPLQNCHVQEMGFWMWRVRAIRLAISMTIHPPPDSDDDPSSIFFDGVFGCPINGSDGPWKTEAQQVVQRTGYRNSFLGMVSELDLTDPSKGWIARCGESFPHNPALPGEIGWAMTASLRVAFSTGIFDTERSSATEQSGMFLTILAGDPILGGFYFHQVPLWIRALTEDWTVTGNALIEPAYYYDWRDEQGHPLFDSSNGHYA